MNSGKAWQFRILVVDEPIITLTLSAILEGAGYEVRTAFNGEEAVEKALTFRPHLLLTEISMGRMNGIDAAIQIAASLPKCKVLFVSSCASISRLLESAPECLAYKHLPKPARVPDLLAAIANLLPKGTEILKHSAIETNDDPMPLHNGARSAFPGHNTWRMTQSALVDFRAGERVVPLRAEKHTETVGQASCDFS